jgi:ABC-2 type transport system ATP-binding protein
LVEVKNLTKVYGQHTAVDHIRFTVEDGEIVGFLGPNGAGKTTTMNIMTGYIAATEGDVKINGADIVSEPERAKSNVGYLPDTPPVYGEMRVDEYLNFVADIKKVRGAERKKMIAGVKEAARIEDMSRRLIKNLSRGYRQRVGLAQALLGDPKVIIMDEPTIGLDPKQIMEMRDVIKRLGKKHTVILSTHILQEVSAVCERVIIINKGRIVVDDALDKIRRSGDGKVHARVRADRPKVIAALADYPVIRLDGCDSADEPDALDLILSGDGGADIREAVFRCMAKHDLPILVMKPSGMSLEEIFLSVIGDARAPAQSEDPAPPEGGHSDIGEADAGEGGPSGEPAADHKE